MKNISPPPASFSRRFFAPLFLLGVLTLLFWRSFLPDFVHFSNDGPLGPQNAAWLQLPGSLTGMWDDLNDVGFLAGAYSPSISAALSWMLGPVGVAKFFAPIALLIAGLGAWAFFRALKLSPPAAMLGALAVMLNSTFFAAACWGVASQQIALGVNLLALALVVANTAETPSLTRWLRLALAGLCVGINIMEAADIGALYSLLVAGFIFFKAITEEGGPLLKKVVRGASSVAVVAIFAAFLAAQTVVALIGTNIQGVAGTGQDTETKAQHWDWATQWSLPKRETLSLLVPGLFGYKMDTPKGMMPQFSNLYQGGYYWGGIGRDPVLDRYLDSGGTGTPPASNFMRFSGGGGYCGILVALLAAWAVAQAFRKQNSPFSAAEKKIIGFWLAVLVFSLLFAWGRFAPFYALLYKLPYFSTIRNPVKFLIFFSWALVVLFAYGVHALSVRSMAGTAAKSADLPTQLKNWWVRAGAFDRKWTYACAGLLGASLLGWLIFAGEKNTFVAYLQKVGFGDDALAQEIAAFSLAQAGWFIPLFALAMALLLLALAGYFSGPRARLGAFLLGAFLVFDLVRADLPYVCHWDYVQKYEVGALNPIVKQLADKPYEHRVAGLPFEAQQKLKGYDSTFGGSGIYRIEWTQHHFPYYNIQSLDLIQMPRMAEDLKTYLGNFAPRSADAYPLMARHWQLTNTRYLLGAAGFLNEVNQLLDPQQQRFRIAQRFDIVPKPGILQPSQLEDLTAALSSDGDLALFEFTGALPRAKLYANWQVNTNDPAVLKTLADLNFDPAKTVLISTPPKNLPATATNENSGTVAFKSYTPKKIVLSVSATGPSVLLLNDKFDPNWRVSVDGKPAELLRCNYIMRGVAVASGPHEVEFDFSLPNKPLYVTLSALGVGILLCGLLLVSRGPADGDAKA